MVQKQTQYELRLQQHKLSQLERYLPTLRLKKVLLQTYHRQARQLLEKLSLEHQQAQQEWQGAEGVLGLISPYSLEALAAIVELEVEEENLAGVPLPRLKTLAFCPLKLQEQDPVWLLPLATTLRELKELAIEEALIAQRVERLAEEVRQVSIRVNLFEKILIPRTLLAIRHIKNALYDQQLSSVARAKVAKARREGSLEAFPSSGGLG